MTAKDRPDQHLEDSPNIRKAARTNTTRRVALVGTLALAGLGVGLMMRTKPPAPSAETAAPLGPMLLQEQQVHQEPQDGSRSAVHRAAGQPSNSQRSLPSLGFQAPPQTSGRAMATHSESRAYDAAMLPQLPPQAPHASSYLGRPAEAPYIQSFAALRLQHPSGSELATIQELNTRVLNRGTEEQDLSLKSAVTLPSPAEIEAQRQKELIRIRKEMKQPAPKRSLDTSLYDPWASEYQNIVQREQAQANQEAVSALRARQEEERRKAQHKKSRPQVR
jgi:hypothetical protein